MREERGEEGVRNGGGEEGVSEGGREREKRERE